jgi:small subunit ribosomal protein S1
MSEPNDTRDAPAGATATDSRTDASSPATLAVASDGMPGTPAERRPVPQGSLGADAAANVVGGADAVSSAAGAAEPDADEGGDDDGEGEVADGGGSHKEESTAGDEGAAADAASGAKKKKRRRRRKRKGGTSAGSEASPGDEASPPAAGEEKVPKPRKDLGHQPFGRFFEATPLGRRHSFAVGDIVAGRVLRVGEGAFVLDLFGKALAVVDEVEPHEVEPPPESEAVEAASGESSADHDVSVDDASAASTAAEDVPASAQDLATTGGSSAESAAADAVADEHAAAAEAVEAEAVQAAADDEAAEADDEPASGASAVGGSDAPALDDEPAPRPMPEVGSVFRGRVGAIAESGHIVLVNRHIDTKAARARIAAAREARRRVRGLVFGYNRGGFDVLVHGVRAFCPASGMSLAPIEDPAEYVGKKLEFSVPLAKPGTHGLVLSRRAILEREARRAQKERLRQLKVGEHVRGRVSQVREFGLFVDIGHGLEGMIHVSELSWDRAVKPSDVASVGDELEAVVIKIPDRRERKERHERVGLSLKALQTDPWEAAGDLLDEGRVLRGKVTRVAEFGAFVEIAPGIEGLLHVSELGDRLTHAKEAVKEGDLVWVVIERSDRKAHRVSLSKLGQSEVQALESGALTPEAIKAVAPPKLGAAVTVVVEKVEHHGVVVHVRGVLGRRGRGYIPNSEMGTERGTDHRKQFPPGTELEVKVIGTDRDGGLKLSRKALRADEEKRAVQDYRREAQKQGFGTFGDLLRAKLGGDKA